MAVMHPTIMHRHSWSSRSSPTSPVGPPITMLTTMPSLQLYPFPQASTPRLRYTQFQCVGIKPSFGIAKNCCLWRSTERRRAASGTSSEFVGFKKNTARVGGMESVQAAAAAADPDDVSALSHIMEPVREGDADLLLVFCPGSLQASENYFPLVREVQAQLALRLWVAVLYNRAREEVSTAKFDRSLTGVMARLKERGFRPGSTEIENVFIAGHSIGAWLARSVAVRRAQGFIQMGCCFDSKADDLSQHPKPVLTVGGGLDGQMTPAAIARHAGEIAAAEPALGRRNTCTTKPVVIIPGMNHAQFSDGCLNTERGDLTPDLRLDEARRRAADLVAAFLAVQAEGPRGAAGGAWGLATLTEAVTATHARYRPLWEALGSQAAGAAAHQVRVAAPSGLTAAAVTCVHHDFAENFVISKPWIDDDDEDAARVFVTTYLAPAEKHGLSNLWVKMKSREAVLRRFGGGGPAAKYDPGALVHLGKEINTETFGAALARIPADARERFLARGKKLRFVDDWLVQGPATIWIESDLSFTPCADGGGVEVKTPVLITPTDGIAARFAGMHYMKVLTLARAMHWILVDSFR